MPLIDVGKKAPAFTLKDQAGRPHKLSDISGRPVVLYFYPKDDTSGCTQQACAFRDALPKFESMEVVVLGVSPDDESSHAKFAAKNALNFPLLADPGATMCEKYGVWQEKSMYGRTYMGVVRTTYLLDGDGRVARRWDKVKVPGHAEEVMEAARTMA